MGNGNDNDFIPGGFCWLLNQYRLALFDNEVFNTFAVQFAPKHDAKTNKKLLNLKTS